MRCLDELVSTVENELANNRGWEFDTRTIMSVGRDGNSLILDMGNDAEITIRFEASGSTELCPECEEVKAGWPHFWRNIAPGKGLRYACHDCVVDTRRHQSDSQASKAE